MNTVEFQTEFLSRAALPKPVDAMTILDKYLATRATTLAQAMELGIGERGRSEIQDKLARAFVRRWMMLSFAAVDLSFTERVWWLKVERVDGEVRIVETFDSEPDLEIDTVLQVVIRAPRFIRANYNIWEFAFGTVNEGTSHKAGEGKLRHGRRGPNSYSSFDVVLRAKQPDGRREKHRALAQKAIAHYTAATVLLYARGLNLRDEMIEPDYSQREGYRGQVSIIWAQNADATTVSIEPPRPTGNPAIIFEIAQHAFLLDFYDTPDEQPIEHLIREFSEGVLPVEDRSLDRRQG